MRYNERSMKDITGGTVTLEPEGYVRIEFVGNPTYRTVDAMCQQTLKHVDELKAAQKPLLGLVDLTRQTGFNTGSNKASVEALIKIEYDRVALVSDKALFGDLANAIIRAVGKGDRSKVFDTRKAALEWLLRPVAPMI